MYKKFHQIDGSHPWREVSQNGYVDYPVRIRKGGKILYFNYSLAKELGLIPANHPKKMTPELENKLLETFSLQIINEYDQENKKSPPKDLIKENPYMATRYLQLQHKNKQGKTSGDGRSIWNGCIKTKHGVYDISSRGVGTTMLSPGMQEAGKPVATGESKYGYASGLADLDEMLASAIVSEIFYLRGIPSERCLLVIDYADKSSIGVRVAPNLIRPAHFFRYLKLDALEDLKASFDYFLKREEINNDIKLPSKGPERYKAALRFIADKYAYLTALMEEEYIFNWLDWDGDNMLANGGLLDYGSIRQFAARHDKYRYEDVDRFSTTLNEQKQKAKQIVQSFAQLINYINTGEKKNFRFFDFHESLELFENSYNKYLKQRMLWKLGFEEKQCNFLIEKHNEKVEAFHKALNYFESIKTINGEEKTSDGVDHPPVFLVRDILRELPNYYLASHNHCRDKNYILSTKWGEMPAEEFCEVMAASYAQHEDLTLTPIRVERVSIFQKLYQDLIIAVSSKGTNNHIDNKLTIKNLQLIAKRSQIINYKNRLTGDGSIFIVNDTIKNRNKINREFLQHTIDRFIESQILIPGKWKPFSEKDLQGSSIKARLLRQINENLTYFNEAV